MNKKVVTLLLSGALFVAPRLLAQNVMPGLTIPAKNGSISMNLKEKQLTLPYISQNLGKLLGLSNKNTYSKQRETTDKLGFTLVSYQQYFQGIKVENALILVHFKDGIATSIQGRVASLQSIITTAAIDKSLAKANAIKELDVVTLLKQYPETLVISSIGTTKLPEYALTYKVRIDGKTSKGKIVMMHVFIDAQTGKTTKKVNLITFNDVTATAHTLYSGTQTIVSDDSIAGVYRLKDNARKIVTYDATGSDVDDGSGLALFLTPANITNATTSWDANPAIMNITLNTASAALSNAIDPGNAAFLTSVIGKDTSNNQSNIQLKAWPDLRFDIASSANLPVTTHNIYSFPKGDASYIGGFGIFDISGANQNLLNAGYFGIQNLTNGIHNWNDGQGNTGSYEIANTNNPALDAHWGMEKTHDFYNQTFNRDSYDGNGSTVINYMNGIWPTSFTQNNAAALPSPYFSMVYGMGDGISYKPFVALDIMGHEFTHMVTESNGNGGLDYQGESGALNESFSDIMGTSIEFFAKGSAANWLCGEDCVLPPAGGFFRSFSNPKSAQFPQPDTYEGSYWDLSDPHIASGVQNKWFYLLCVGGTGTNDKGDNYHVYGIGIDKAEQIAYRNLTQYLTPDATFLDAYEGSVQAAKDLYGDTSDAFHSVKNAWYAVGIGDADTTMPSGLAVENIDINAHLLKLYPNPATNQVTITSDIDQKLNAHIINAIGINVMDLRIRKGNNTINIQSLSKGNYYIKYELKNKAYTQKLSIF